MKPVTIITDSSAYLPKKYCDQYGIKVAPLSVQWEGKVYRDGIDIQPTEFYTRLKSAKVMPTTSQATVNDFTPLIKEVLDAGHAVLILPISSGISATMQSAMQACDLFPGEPVEVMETRLVSMALSFMVLTAARAAEQGASLEEVKAVAERAYEHIGVFFTVETLEYLRRGGRIGGAKHLLGTALSIKPVLHIHEGKIESAGSAISRGRAIERMVDLVEEGIAGRSPVRISVFHALEEGMAIQLQERVAKKFNAVEAILSEVSPVVGTHVGPGTLSIAYMAGM